VAPTCPPRRSFVASDARRRGQVFKRLEHKNSDSPDLKEALPALAGTGPLNPSASALLKGQFRNLYVAMSRPSHFLCVAVNKDRTTAVDTAALEAQGWIVHRLN
jgi:hypothetical protein